MIWLTTICGAARYSRVGALALLAGLIALPLASGTASASRSRPANVGNISWGAAENTPEWNQSLHINATRQGCSSAPEKCVEGAAEITRKNPSITRVFLAVPFNTQADYAQRYSKLSLSQPSLVEVGIDDFVGQYIKAAKATSPETAESNLSAFIGNLKSANPNLGFGITVYGSELDSPNLRAPLFPDNLRAQVDFVHLYLIYRTDGPHIADYVGQAHRLFPNAKIIGGVYAYDRQDFVPCARGGAKCTTQQASNLFAKATKIETKLLKRGDLYALETIPGYFGREANWPGWHTDPHSCSPERQSECIQNTIALRQQMLDILSKSERH